MLENHSNNQATILNNPYAQSPETAQTLPFADLTPKIPSKIYTQHQLEEPEDGNLHASLRPPLNFQYTPESPQSLYSSSTRSHSRPEHIEKERTTIAGGLPVFGSQIGESDWDDQDKDRLRNSKRRKLRDPEKIHTDGAEPMSRRRSTLNSHHTTFTYISHSGSMESDDAEDRTLWILIYLSFLSPVLTLPITLYTLLLTPVFLILSPLSACTSFASFSTHISTFLCPPLKLQLSFIASDIDGAETAVANPSVLILIHIFSPVYALGIALSAWVAAVFWAYAVILGDPDGRDRNDDGRTAVLGVRVWWQRWLERGLIFQHDN